MAFAEIAAILLDVLQHDSAVPDPAFSHTSIGWD